MCTNKQGPFNSIEFNKRDHPVRKKKMALLKVKTIVATCLMNYVCHKLFYIFKLE
jgi:hypothetical protein